MSDTSNLPPSGQPSRNPSVDGRLYGVFRLALNKFLQGNIDDMLPAQVIAYDRATNFASVQPMINVVTTLNTVQQRAPIASVPVLQLGGGGFVLNFPINPGDIGFLKSNDRDISLFKQVWRIISPASGRMHSFEDAIFIPSILTGFTIQSEDAANVVLQNLAGTVRVAIWADQVKVTAPTVIIDAPVINLDCTTTTINGNLVVTGTIQADGNITSGSGGTGVDMLNHTHPGVMTGGGDTGPPNGGT